MKSSWQDMKGMLLLPHVSCKTSGNCIHVSYTNTHRWDTLFQRKDTQKDILKNCYPHPLWNFTILSTVWNSETKNIGKTLGRWRRGESSLFPDVEKNRREAAGQSVQTGPGEKPWCCPLSEDKASPGKRRQEEFQQEHGLCPFCVWKLGGRNMRY